MKTAIYPGSFNPIHEGHIKIYHHALSMGFTVIPEVCVQSCDKDKKDDKLLYKITNQFLELRIPVILSTYSLFSDKSWIFRDVTFIVGSDTMERVLNQAYYDNITHMIEGLNYIHSRGNRFMVYPRTKNYDWTLIHKGIRSFNLRGTYLVKSFEPVEISSTELREKRND